MTKQSEILKVYLQANDTYTVRTEVSDGISYKVVPVVLMQEGVHNGNHGPIYHSAEELGKVVDSWNGIPITVTHPQVEEAYVPANSPEILQEFGVGRVFNTFLDGKQLKAEAWLEETKITEYENLNDRVDNGEIVEVSVGVYSDEVEQEGVWNDENFTAIAVNHIPEHLALLPNETGACSVADGCGLRVNNKSNNEVKLITNENRTTVLTELNGKGYKVDLSVFEDGMQATVEKIRSKLYAMDDREVAYFYLEEVYDTYLIYQKHDKVNDESRLYKQSYAMNNGVVEFAEDTIPVNKEVKYVPITSNNNLTVNKMSKKECTPCVKERVDALIVNSVTTYAETDRDWMEGMTVEQLDKMSPTKETVEVEVNKEVTNEMVVNAFKGKTTSEFLELMPKEMQGQMKAGLALHADHKLKLVTGIMANAEGVWGKEELEGMEVEGLEKIAKTANVQTNQEVNNFSGMGAGTQFQVNTSDEEPMLPLGVTKSE